MEFQTFPFQEFPRMFDLFRSREKTKRVGLSILLGAVALSMLVYLIPSGAPLSSRQEEVVAEIGSDVLTARQIESQIRNFTQGRQISPEVMYAVLPQILEGAITDQALAYEAKRLGFEVSDAEVARELRASPQFANISPREYQQYVERQFNLGVQEFENNFRTELYRQDVFNLALEGAYVSQAQVEAEYKRRND